ncbi:hypothetical protein Q8F55_008865 [Vanrija albida]|uniref:CNH domain-containing protein n=1 Tax=Vanrija albida TaxID=181172 RepID=A0ABR3PS11_9TREE
MGDAYRSQVAVAHGPRVAVFTSNAIVIFEDAAFEPLPAAEVPRLRATILKRPERSSSLMHLFVSMDERAIYEVVSDEEGSGPRNPHDGEGDRDPKDRLRIISFGQAALALSPIHLIHHHRSM